MYMNAVEDRRGTFTPFVFSVDGLLNKEASHFLNHMAIALSHKWNKAYSVTSSYVQSWLTFPGVHTVRFCLRGSQSNGEVGLDLMMVLLWPHSWSKRICLFVFLCRLYEITFYHNRRINSMCILYQLFELNTYNMCKLKQSKNLDVIDLGKEYLCCILCYYGIIILNTFIATAWRTQAVT